MERLHASVSAVAAEWADVAATSKGIEAGHPLRGEDWLAGPYGVVTALEAYRSTLLKLAKGGSPLTGVKTDAAPGGRVRAHVFPLGPVDGLLLSGFTGEVWFEPGVTDDEARRTAGLAQLAPTTPAASGSCSAPETSARSRCSTCCTNCWRTTASRCSSSTRRRMRSLPVFERALAPLIEPGFVRIVRGGPEVGAYLTGHAGIAHVHITGAAATFDAIVWGPSTGAGCRAPPRVASARTVRS